MSEEKENSIQSKLEEPVIKRVLDERNQGPETRRRIYSELGKILKKPVVTFFTSFTYPVMIESKDADMVEGVLQKIDLSNGLALLINSPGGNGLAAEKVIRICRSYSKTKEYSAIVASKAKSAATMICFGASKIVMGPTSELGPIDPQVTIIDAKGNHRLISACHIVNSYRRLFSSAVSEEGHLEPYIQQLSKYDEREITEYETAIELSEDIAVKALKSGMMKNESEETIKEKIKVFLTPEETKTHGRAIHREDAKKYGLTIEKREVKEKFWELVYELYIRLDNFVSTRAAKCIESQEHSFIAEVKQG